MPSDGPRLPCDGWRGPDERAARLEVCTARRRLLSGEYVFSYFSPRKRGKKLRKAAAGQKEMLMPIDGKKPTKETAAKKAAARSQRKSA
jgi:DNA end-binding protein Ku